jgi:hypothetical protein
VVIVVKILVTFLQHVCTKKEIIITPTPVTAAAAATTIIKDNDNKPYCARVNYDKFIAS